MAASSFAKTRSNLALTATVIFQRPACLPSKFDIFDFLKAGYLEQPITLSSRG